MPATSWKFPKRSLAFTSYTHEASLGKKILQEQKGPYRANSRGVRDSGLGQRDRSPRKPMGPGKFQAPCTSLGQLLRHFSYRAQASMPTTRNRGSVLHLLPIFQRMHLESPNGQLGTGSQEREEGQSPTTAWKSPKRSLAFSLIHPWGKLRRKFVSEAKRRRVGRPLEKNTSALFQELMLARFCEPLCCSYGGANKTCWRSVGDEGKETSVGTNYNLFRCVAASFIHFLHQQCFFPCESPCELSFGKSANGFQLPQWGQTFPSTPSFVSIIL